MPEYLFGLKAVLGNLSEREAFTQGFYDGNSDEGIVHLRIGTENFFISPTDAAQLGMHLVQAGSDAMGDEMAVKFERNAALAAKRD